MKKYLLTYALLLISFLNLSAQNWQTVPSNDTNWFVINNTSFDQSGRLRVVWLDSSISIGNISTQYFYPALRLNASNCIDTAGASWLGKKFTRNQLTGEEQYYNVFDDTIILQTKAQLNDSWIVVTDSSNIDIVATVISDGLLIIDGNLDSIKTIQLQSFNLSNPIAHDYNTEIILSKNHGFVRALEWYAFPYTFNYNFNAIQSFTSGHNRLDKNKTIVSLNEAKSKFTPGNEWITENTLFSPMAIYPAPGIKTFIHDSIISRVDTTIGYRITYDRKQKIIDFDNSTLTISDSILSEVIDTTTYLSNRIVDVLPEYLDFEFGQHPIFYQNANGISIYHYTVTYGCNQQIKLEKTFFGSGSIHDISSGCYGYAVPLVDPFYLPHVNVTHEEIVGLDYRFDTDYGLGKNEFKYTYYNINSCIYGAKYNILLPADAFDLQATLHNQNQIKLNWQTVNEHHVTHFEIERSTDGIHFFTIQQTASQGENANTNLYTWYDDISSIKSTIYYRVKMVDIDAQIKYSNITYVNLNITGNPTIFPTIFSTKITVAGLRKENGYTIQLVDIYGRIVYNSMQESNNTGQISLTQIDHLAKGNYILICQDQDGVVVREKVTKVE